MSNRRKDPPPSIPISTDRDGRSFRGSYTVQDGIVDVHLVEGRGSSKATQVGDSPAEEVATWLLDELVDEFLAKSKSD